MYDRETREQAARLLAEGRGHRVISNRLNIPVATARTPLAAKTPFSTRSIAIVRIRWKKNSRWRVTVSSMAYPCVK